MFRYRLAVWLLAPVLVAYTVWMALRHRDARYLCQRLGFGRHDTPPGAIWVHAASVGEVSAAGALVRQLAERAPNRRVVLTTVTPTGGAIARTRLGDWAAQRYLPLDWPWAVRRFVRVLRPACLLVMETELWPNLYRACARMNVPIVIINGRLSMRSLHENRWWRRVQRETLGHVRAVLARSAADAETFMSLGMEAGRVRTLGNLKFAVTGGDAPPPPALSRRYVLAASTRNSEEKPIAEQWRRARHAERLLVIAPRHPQRLEEILNELAPSGLRIAVRSRGDAVDASTDVYIADTLGELRAFMLGAEFVIMGGAFASFGGHNILEAAQAGKAVLYGPNMQNFAEEAELLRASEAGIQLRSVEELGACLDELFAHPDRVTALGQNGARLMTARTGVIDDYLAALAELCPALEPGASYPARNAVQSSS